MISKTKNRLTSEEIQKMIHKAFPEEAAKESNIKELTEGSFNVVYSIELPSGMETILKIAPSPDTSILSYETGIMNTEVSMMRLIKEKIDVSIPNILFYDDSKTICRVPYFFMEKLSGESFESVKYHLSEEVQAKILTQMGGCNKSMNQVKGEFFGYPGNVNLQSGNWENAFSKILEQILLDVEKREIELGVPYCEIRSLLHENSKLLQDVTEPQFVHWDLWDGNVMVKDENITGVIDFERSLWGDPLMEYYFFDITQDNTTSAFLKGYQKTSFTASEIKKRALYNLHMFTVMIVDHVNRGYQDDGLYNWATSMLKKMVELLK